MTTPIVDLTTPEGRTNDTTPALAGTAGHCAGDATYTVKMWKGTRSAGAASRVFSGITVASDGSWSLPSSAYDSNASTQSTSDDKLSGDEIGSATCRESV